MNHDLRAGLTAIRPTTSISAGGAQQVRDAAAALQLRRADLAARILAGERVDAEVVAVGLAEMNAWTYDNAGSWRELMSTRSVGSADHVRRSIPINRQMIEQGLTMISLFDYWGTEPAARQLLVNEPVGNYVFGLAPVEMKIVDQRYVLLLGPTIDDDVSLMRVTAAGCLDAAWRYWTTALANTVPVERVVTDHAELSPRQQQVVALMAADIGDEGIAAALGVSVRTVRSDIAALLQALGVRSRFAAGARLGASRTQQPDLSPDPPTTP